MRRAVGLAVLAVTAAAACATVASADFVLPTPTQVGPNTRVAADAVNAAIRAVDERDHTCLQRPRPRRGSATHDPPPQDMLDAFAVLRRPATPADAIDPERLRSRSPRGRRRLHPPRARAARTAPRSTSSRPSSARPAVTKRPAPASAREREALEHRLRGQPGQARRAARRLLRQPAPQPAPGGEHRAQARSLPLRVRATRRRRRRRRRRCDHHPPRRVQRDVRPRPRVADGRPHSRRRRDHRFHLRARARTWPRRRSRLPHHRPADGRGRQQRRLPHGAAHAARTPCTTARSGGRRTARWSGGSSPSSSSARSARAGSGARRRTRATGSRPAARPRRSA